MYFIIALVYTIAYNMNFRWEWDEIKNVSNFKKHQVWFEEAQTIWADSQSLEFFDSDHSFINEERFIRIGHSGSNKLLLVVFCEKAGGAIIRIISARKASLNERKEYEEAI